ncbi:hypothetical protein ACF0H5_010063 [Mactra antiquata]
MGVPQPILQNFLKSVQRTANVENMKRGKKEKKDSNMEESDSHLDFKPLTRSWCKINDKNDTDENSEGNYTSDGGRNIPSKSTVIVDNSLLHTVVSAANELEDIGKIHELVENSDVPMCSDSNLRNNSDVITSDMLSDIKVSQEFNNKNLESQGCSHTQFSELPITAGNVSDDCLPFSHHDGHIPSSDDDDDIQSTTGDAVIDFDNVSIRSEHSDDFVNTST